MNLVCRKTLFNKKLIICLILNPWLNQDYMTSLYNNGLILFKLHQSVLFIECIKIIIVLRNTLIYYHITLLKCCVNLG